MTRGVVLPQNPRVLRCGARWRRRCAGCSAVPRDPPASSRVAVGCSAVPAHSPCHARPDRATNHVCVAARADPTPPRKRFAVGVRPIGPEVANILERAVLIHPAAGIGRVCLAIALPRGHIRGISRPPSRPYIPGCAVEGETSASQQKYTHRLKGTVHTLQYSEDPLAPL